MAEGETPAQLEIVFSKALTLEIPSSVPTSLTSSPQSSSPTGALDSSCATSASCSSLPTTRRPSLNVKFAPLPELAPRKRRSTAPLGMAARAQLVRRRRGYQDPDQGPRYNAGTNPMWTEEELAEARMKQIAAAMEKERQRREHAGGYDPNDPLVVLGKKMKEASKQLWKKVSKKDMKEAAAPTEKVEGEEGAKNDSENSSNSSLDGKPPSEPVSPEVRSRCNSSAAPAAKSAPTPRSSTPVSSKPSTPIDPSAPLRSILIASPPPPPLPERTRIVEVVQQQVEEEEQGGVWEEEIDPHFPLNASQVETSFDSLSVSNRRSVMLNVSNFPTQSSSSLDDCSTPTNANPDAKLDAAAGQSPSTIQQNQGP
ncbi:hypothetical protein H1R20_g3979, partial [Candolleomyces eurysporus]